MRDILFRGKRENNGEWVYGYGVIDGDILHLDLYVGIIRVPCSLETVGLYTGLKDKNSKPIFTGDIVEYETYNGKYVGIVQYGKFRQDGSGGEYGGSDCLGFFIKREKCILDEWEDKDDIEWKMRRFDETISILEVDHINIIGNIYDTPELLK